MTKHQKKLYLDRLSWRLILLTMRWGARIIIAIDSAKKLPTKIKQISPITWVAVALVVTGILLRIIPHAANFTPVGAIALFGGAVLGSRFALWLPLAVMVVSDLFLGSHGTMLFTWSGFMLVGAFGMLLKNKSNYLRVPIGSLGAALIFYIVSNFGVWVEGKLYTYTWQGLVDCYVAALPFLRNELIADLLFTSALFGAYWLAGRVFVEPKTAEVLK